MAAESACPQRRAVPKSLTEMGFRVVTVMLKKVWDCPFLGKSVAKIYKSRESTKPENLNNL
jgi:Fe-S-cluster containining protein